MAADGDPALQTLLQPFVDGTLAWPASGALFLRARDGWPLHRQPLPGLVCETGFKPDFDQLRRSGLAVREDRDALAIAGAAGTPPCGGTMGDAEPTGVELVSAVHGDVGHGGVEQGAVEHGSAGHDDFVHAEVGQDDAAPADGDHARHPLVLLLPPRQREQARALFARAIAATAPGGIVVASMANDEGARSGQADLARLAGPLQALSKHHCRVFWSAPLQGAIDPALAAQWLAADAPRVIADGRFLSRPGVFAWDRVDAASALLAAHLPPDLAGHVADLGAGYGYLSSEVLARCAQVTALDLYEADARALALAGANLARSRAHATLGFHWHDVATGLPQCYDAIVSNPPFHAQGRDTRPELGRAFIAAAADALRDGGRLLLVANRHLPYEQVLDARFADVRVLAQQSGFKVIQATRAGIAVGTRR